jgi:hypothetical protein
MRQLAIVLCLGSLGSFGAACGGSGGGDGPDADIVSYNCATETRADTFSVGLEKTGAAGLFDFKLMTADPAPPARGDNTWVIEVDSASAAGAGAPVAGLQSGMTVVPYMPDHMHGTPITVEITPASTTGQYTLTPVNLWMPGLWETTIQVDSNGTKDHAVFSFCLSS